MLFENVAEVAGNGDGGVSEGKASVEVMRDHVVLHFHEFLNTPRECMHSFSFSLAC